MFAVQILIKVVVKSISSSIFNYVGQNEGSNFLSNTYVGQNEGSNFLSNTYVGENEGSNFLSNTMQERMKAAISSLIHM